MHFLKNLGLLGGLILAAFDTEGQPSLGWRAKRQARELETTIGVGRAKVGRAPQERLDIEPLPIESRQADDPAGASYPPARRRTSEGRSRPGPRSGPDADELRHARDGVADAVRDSSGSATHAVQHAASIVTDAVRQLEPIARDATHAGIDAIAPYLVSGTERTTDALSKVREHLPVD